MLYSHSGLRGGDYIGPLNHGTGILEAILECCLLQQEKCKFLISQIKGVVEFRELYLNAVTSRI